MIRILARILSFSAFLLLLPGPANAQFDQSSVEKSLVRAILLFGGDNFQAANNFDVTTGIVLNTEGQVLIPFAAFNQADGVMILQGLGDPAKNSVATKIVYINQQAGIVVVQPANPIGSPVTWNPRLLSSNAGIRAVGYDDNPGSPMTGSAVTTGSVTGVSTSGGLRLLNHSAIFSSGRAVGVSTLR